MLRLEQGHFGFTDQTGARFDGTQKLAAELTIKDGKVVFDLNGLSATPWDKIPAGGRPGDPRWDSFTPARGGRAPNQKKSATPNQY